MSDVDVSATLDADTFEVDVEGPVLFGADGPPGPAGPAGPTGPAGAAGVGVPVGGTTGQSLTKHSNTDYDTQWATITSGGGAPTGAAGGSLAGTYPNPTIAAGIVDNATLASMAASTVKGRLASTGAPQDLTGTQLTTLVNQFTTSLSGAAPASGGGTTNYLRADGAWAAPAGGGGAPSGPAGGSLAGTYPNPTIAANSVTTAEILNGTVANADLVNMANGTVKGNVAGSTTVPADLTATQLTTLVNAFTTSLSGAAPASGGGTTNFLRADGTWAAPAGGGGGGGVLGRTTYTPGSNIVVNTTSSTATDVDATNLAVTFTAPSSGAVIVDLTANTVSGSSSQLSWNLRSGAADVAGTISQVSFNAIGLEIRLTSRHIVTGLTAGNSYTYKWGHARTFGSNTTSTSYGADRGAAVMVVWSA